MALTVRTSKDGATFKAHGDGVVLWPFTDDDRAQMLAEVALMLAKSARCGGLEEAATEGDATRAVSLLTRASAAVEL